MYHNAAPPHCGGCLASWKVSVAQPVWHNSLRYIKLQVNNKRLCSQGVLVFKWITLVTSVSQGDLWHEFVNFIILNLFKVVKWKLFYPLKTFRIKTNSIYDYWQLLATEYTLYFIVKYIKNTSKTLHRQFNSTMKTILREKRRVACLTLEPG
jgi:hypothetical protein